MLARLLTGFGLFMFGYYVGREIGRTQHIREELQQAREGDEQSQKLLEKGAVPRVGEQV
jgi:hypothetical protein